LHPARNGGCGGTCANRCLPDQASVRQGGCNPAEWDWRETARQSRGWRTANAQQNRRIGSRHANSRVAKPGSSIGVGKAISTSRNHSGRIAAQNPKPGAKISHPVLDISQQVKPRRSFSAAPCCWHAPVGGVDPASWWAVERRKP